MQTDVKATWCAAGATIAYADRTRIKSLTISYKASVTGAYTTVKVYDTKNYNGGDLSPYPLMFLFEAPLVDGSIHIIIPGEGILVKDGLGIECTSGTSASVFYG